VDLVRTNRQCFR